MELNPRPCDVPNSFIKNSLQTPLSQGGALDIFHRTNLLSDLVGSLPVDRFHALLSQTLLRRRVLSQIEFRADEDDGHVWCVMFDFGEPLKQKR